MRLRAMLLVTAALFAAGCEDADRCDGDCPDISGIYSIKTMSVFGACSFTALTVGPTLTLEQSEDRRRVFAELIDPVNQVKVLVAADVSRFDDEDEEGGVFNGSSELPDTENEVDETADGGSVTQNRLWVSFSGTVQVVDGRRRLSAHLTTHSIQDPCTESISITGEGPFVP